MLIRCTTLGPVSRWSLTLLGCSRLAKRSRCATLLRCRLLSLSSCWSIYCRLAWALEGIGLFWLLNNLARLVTHFDLTISGGR